MRILIDTNSYSDLDEGDSETINRIEAADEVWISFIVLGELFAGFELGSHKEQNENQLKDFLRRPNVGVLLPDEKTARHYGQIFHELRRQGTPIPTNDIWIAAQAIQHGLLLETGDRHFLYVPGLTLLRHHFS